MARQKVEVDVTANTKGATKGFQEVGKAAQLLQGLLGRLGVVGQGISSILDKFTGKSLDMTAALGVGVAAVGATIAIGEKAIDMYVSLGNKVRAYAVATGQSAEAASRQIGAFEELGVGADVAQAGMIKLAKAVTTNVDGLAALGIQVAYNADGTRDLNGTLLNVMNAYQGTADAGKRAAIVLAAFGRAGSAMIPILETNIGQLKELEKQIASVYTQKDLDQIRSYEIAQKHLKEQTDDLGVSIGRTLLPAQAAFIESLNENIYVSQRLTEAEQGRTTSLAVGSHAIGKQVQALGAEYRAAQDAKVEIDRLAQAQRDAADAAKAEEDAENTLYDAIHKSTDASFAYRQSLLDLKKAQKDAHDAKGKDAEANLRLEQAYHRVADAAVDLANDQRAANGQAALSTDEAVTIEIGALEKLMKGMDKNSPLYKNLAAYVALLQKQVDLQRAAASTALSQTPSSILSRSRGGHGQLMDDGGTVAGPPGSLQPVLARGGEQFSGYPPKPMGGSGVTLNVIVQGGLYSDGPGLDRLTMAIANRLGYVTGR